MYAWPKHAMGFGDFFGVISTAGVQKRSFFQSTAARNTISMRHLMPLGRPASDPLDLRDELNWRPDSGIALPAYVGVPRSFGSWIVQHIEAISQSSGSTSPCSRD